MPGEHEKEIEALIRLLDDSDEEVSRHVREKLLSYGEEVVPVLEDFYIRSDSQIRSRLDELIDTLQNKNLTQGLEKWAEGGGRDLLEGVYYVCRIGYPNLQQKDILKRIDRIKMDAWLELHNSSSPFDQIRILNHVLYQIHGLKGSGIKEAGPDDSYINRVLEKKSGTPLSLSIVYCLVAQRLNIPVFGINLPHHFVVAYKALVNNPPIDKPVNRYDLMNPKDEGEVLFYINAYNQGTIFSKWNIDRFLKQLKQEPRPAFYEPCSNIEIILRMLRNLTLVYETKQNHSRVRYINSLIATLQPWAD